MFDKKNMEINPSHPVMTKLSQSLDDESESESESVSELVEILYSSALLSSGYQLDDINGYLKKVYTYMS